MPQLKLASIESERGDLEHIIPALLKDNDGSQKRVAELLGVAPSTVSLWLKANGYTMKKIWVKEKRTS